MHLVAKAVDFFVGRQLYYISNIAYMESLKITDVWRKIDLSLDVEWMGSPITCLAPFLFHTEQQGEKKINKTLQILHTWRNTVANRRQKRESLAVYQNLRIECILNNVQR